MIYLWIFIGLVLLFILWSFLEQKIIVKSKYTIDLQKNNNFNRNLSFLVLSDIHNKSFGKSNKRLVKKILEQKPDFVIIAGDLITKRVPCYPSNAYDLIKELSDHYPIYYAYGNHEQAFEDLTFNDNKVADQNNIALYESWNLFKEKIMELGVHLLDNKSLIIHYRDSKLTITGLSIANEYYGSGKSMPLNQNEIQNSIGNRNSEGYQILIAHNPIFFKAYMKWGADLVLSGHVHGGLVRIPFIGGLISPQVKLFPKYDGGQFTENDKHMIVSRGLGTHSFMPRILNPPEIIVIRLKA